MNIHQSRFSDIPPVRWGEADPLERGPLVCINRPDVPYNCIGNYGGQYMLYRAAMETTGRIPREHIPDYSNFITMDVPMNNNWFGQDSISSFDPFGHLVPNLFASRIAKGYNVRPTVAMTATTLVPKELREAMKEGRLKADGKILTENGVLKATKIAMEPVWYLPGMAKHYGVSEEKFREGLFYGTGESYRDLVERPDLKVFLPPFGETTVYVIGDFENVGKPDVFHASRTHDKCGSSDTHRAQICSCAPALMWAYEESIRVAQDGGIGLVVYTEAEGRGHGIVIKNGVYNRRSSGPDLPQDYFRATEEVAGIADLRNQNLATDVYRWLGVSRIDAWLSGSPEKTGAMKRAGIQIMCEKPLPPELMDADTALTEWEAKRTVGGYNYQPRGLKFHGKAL